MFIPKKFLWRWSVYCQVKRPSTVNHQLKKHLLVTCLFYALFCPAQKNISLDFASNQYEDLFFLKDLIGDKRVVCLGEEDHHYGEYFQLKNRIIKFLVEEMDFSVLVFEASGKHSLVPNITKIPIEDRLPLTLNRFWQTESVYDIIQFITDKEVMQLGIDPISFEDPKGYYSSILKKIVRPYSAPLYEQFLVINKELKIAQNQLQGSQLGKPTIKEEQAKNYQHIVSNVINLLTNNRLAILKAQNWQEQQFQLLLYALQCMQEEISFLEQKGWPAHMIFRDKSMAKNLLWFLQEYAPDKKMIVWSANLHLAKNTVIEKRFKKKGFVSMLELLPASTKKEILTFSLSPIKFLKNPTNLPQSAVFYVDQSSLPPKDKERGFDGGFYFRELTTFRKFLRIPPK